MKNTNHRQKTNILTITNVTTVMLATLVPNFDMLFGVLVSSWNISTIRFDI